MTDSEITGLAKAFAPETLETVALPFLNISHTEIKNLKYESTGTEDFKRSILITYLNKDGSREVNVYFWLRVY